MYDSPVGVVNLGWELLACGLSAKVEPFLHAKYSVEEKGASRQGLTSRRADRQLRLSFTQRIFVLRVGGGGGEPGRVLHRRRGHLVQGRDLRVQQLYVDRLQIVFELIHLGGAENDASDKRFRHQPSQRDLRYARPVCAPDFAHLFDDAETQFLIKGNKVEAGQAISLLLLFLLEALTRVFPAQKPAGQRTPHRHAGASGAQKGHEFVFEIAREQRVIHLSAGETRPAALFLNGKRRGRLPCWPIGKTEIADLSGAHEIV